MADFDPDAYLASAPKHDNSPKPGDFDADGYLKAKRNSRKATATDIPELRAAEPDSVMTKLRESLSGLIGKTDRQKMASLQDRMAMERDMPQLAALASQSPKDESMEDGAIPAIASTASSASVGGLDKFLAGKAGLDAGAATAGAMAGMKLGAPLGPVGRLAATGGGAMSGYAINRIRQALSDKDPSELGTPGGAAEVGIGATLTPGVGKILPTALKTGLGAVTARNAGHVLDTGQLASSDDDLKTALIASLLGGGFAKLTQGSSQGARSSKPVEVAKDNARAMVEKGAAVLPDEFNPTIGNKVLTKIAGKGAVAKAVESKSSDAYVKGALRAMGQPETALLNADTHARAQVAPAAVFDDIIAQGAQARENLANAKQVGGVPHSVINNLKEQAGNDLKAWQEADSYARGIQKKIDAEGVAIGSTGTPHNLAQDLAAARAEATAAGNRVRDGLRAAGQPEKAEAFDWARTQFRINGEVERASNGFHDGTISGEKVLSKEKRSGMPEGELNDIAAHRGAVKKGLDSVKEQSLVSALTQKFGPYAVGYGLGGPVGVPVAVAAKHMALKRLMSEGVQRQAVQPRYNRGAPVDNDLAKMMRYASIQAALGG